MKITLRLYATLQNYYSDCPTKGIKEIEIENDSQVVDVIDYLKIPHEEIKIIVLNDKKTTFDARLKDGDNLFLFPPMTGG